MNQITDDVKFTPLDLSAYANAGPEAGRSAEGWRWLPGGPLVRTLRPDLAALLTGFPFGKRRFWGIPFTLADPAANNGLCWLTISGDPAANLPQQVIVTLPKPALAGCLVFAHCTDVEGPEAQIGELLATYTIVLANGERVAWPVRRRFEIAARQPALGTQGYATVRHDEPRPVRLARSAREHTGITSDGSPQAYWLWAAENPMPDQPVVAVELAARHADIVVVGGITLARDSSNPLRRSRRTAVRIALLPPGKSTAVPAAASTASATYLPEPEVVAVPPTGQEHSVSLSVDLGQVVRAVAANPPTPETWQDAPVKGWGDAPAEVLPQAIYAEVYAADDAGLTIRRGAMAWEIPWRDVAAGEARSAGGEARVQVAHAQEARVRVRVVDADTGHEIPVRVHLRGPDGEYLPPRGHTPDVNANWGEDIGGDLRLGSTNYAYVPGRFEANLPVGPVYAEIVRGFEYAPLREALTISPGQSELRLALRRWTDARQRGYYCGDVHVHFLDPATAALEVAAEDLNVTNILAAQFGRFYTNVEHGIGSLAPTSTAEHLIRIDSENRHHVMGHIFLLGLRQPVLPLSSGGPSEDELGGWEKVALADWCDACRAQGGLVVTQFMPTPHAEVVANIVLGKIEATEVRWFDFAPYVPPGGHWGDSPFVFPGIAQWYRYLNCGYRLPAVGGTDKMSNGMAVGALRTYARLGRQEEFNHEAWCRAIRRGHTFVSSGPLIELEVEGRAPGDDIHLPAGGGTMQVLATAHSAQPFEFIEIVQNGQVVARAQAAPDGLSARLSTNLRINESSWLAARCYGRGKMWVVWPLDIGAHTSAVYVTVGGQRQTSTKDANYLLTLLEGGLTYLDSLAVWRDERQREH
ncbi:MAG: CehA/McbA family metallohydrolase, partial [Anaerolineae bacterium]|nr:CehA/McbA family metallohydrolase [Anaerolineae bacterium]